MVGAILLAAGMGKRIGKPKALLRYNENYLIESVISMLVSAEFSPLIIVVNKEVEEVLNTILSSAAYLHRNHTIVVNEDLDKGTLFSIHLGLEKLPSSCSSVLIQPVDHPFVKLDTLVQLKNNASSNTIIIPTYNGRRGHPPLLGSDFFSRLFELPLNEGARAIYRQVEESVREVVVEDPGVLLNVNRNEDWLSGLKMIGAVNG